MTQHTPTQPDQVTRSPLPFSLAAVVEAIEGAALRVGVVACEMRFSAKAASALDDGSDPSLHRETGDFYRLALAEVHLAAVYLFTPAVQAAIKADPKNKAAILRAAREGRPPFGHCPKLQALLYKRPYNPPAHGVPHEEDVFGIRFTSWAADASGHAVRFDFAEAECVRSVTRNSLATEADFADEVAEVLATAAARAVQILTRAAELARAVVPLTVVGLFEADSVNGEITVRGMVRSAVDPYGQELFSRRFIVPRSDRGDDRALELHIGGGVFDAYNLASNALHLGKQANIQAQGWSPAPEQEVK